MNWPLIINVASYVFGAGGVVAWLATWRQRVATTNKVNVEVSELSQKIYQGIIADLKREIGEMKQEIFMLREILESYKKECDACPNKKK